MIIISWDVGIIHLAYCIMKYNYNTDTGKSTVDILDWDEINLIDDPKMHMTCCGKTKATKKIESKICGKNAIYCMNTPNDQEPYGFCKTHLSQHSQYWSLNDTYSMFNAKNTDNLCCYIKSDESMCGKKTKYCRKDGNQKMYYCTTHYKSELKKKIKEHSPQPIKKLISKKYSTDKLQFSLLKKLDNLSKHFALLGVEEVVIENQPSMKNPKMKSISNTLFDYFMIRGYIDKIHNLDIKLVRFMCPSNKLKVNADNTIEVFKANDDDTKKYKLTKALGIEYTRKLLENDNDQLEYLNLYKKKDDICDAYLQGRYYLECIKNKKDIPKIKTKAKKIKANSKSTGKLKKNNSSASSTKVIKKKNNIIVI